MDGRRQGDGRGGSGITDHVGCVVGSDGAVLQRFDTAHDERALTALAARFRAGGVQDVAIERGDGPVVKVPLLAGFSVFVVPSRQIKSVAEPVRVGGEQERPVGRLCARGHAEHLMGTGGGRCARTATTPGHCARCAGPGRDLVETRVQIMKQLRANLRLALRGAVGLFSRLDSKITVAFLRCFPTQEKVARLSVKRFDSWLASVG